MAAKIMTAKEKRNVEIHSLHRRKQDSVTITTMKHRFSFDVTVGEPQHMHHTGGYGAMEPR